MKDGCVAMVPRAQFACSRHWFQLPKHVRDEIWRAFRREGIGSDALMRAHNAAYSAWGDA